MDGEALHELKELVKSIRNRCEIFLLIAYQDNAGLFPTILEDLYVDAQKIIDEYCVEVEQ